MEVGMEPGDALAMAGVLAAAFAIVRIGGLALLGFAGWAAASWALLQAGWMQVLACWIAVPAACALIDGALWAFRRPRISRI
ncbi:hypothetical protein WV31_10390 [Magnetospirillum sp. ME-1]|nr:hypothetical protein WV31_10390 [Magnetospirillum sp. ME-1]